MIATDPAAGASGVPLNAEVSATFNTWMNPETINSSTFIVMQGNTPVPGEVSYEGFTAVFTPTNPLAPNTQYTARITTGAEALLGGRYSGFQSDDRVFHPFLGYLILAQHFQGHSGVGHGHGHWDHRLLRRGLESDFVWSFTTSTTTGPDVTAPRVSSTVPSNSATGVPLGRDLAVTFTEAMNPATINASTVTLSRGSVPVLGAVSYVGVTAVFNPLLNLAPNTLYTARVTTGAQDLAGNALAAEFVWTFTTGTTLDTTAPTVTFTDPANGATGVPPNKRLNVAFSEPMNPTTINADTFTLRSGATPISGEVTYTGITAVFRPFAPMTPGGTYTATVHNEATDLAGNELANDFVWTFTIGDAVDSIRPVVSSTSPVNGAMDVPPNKQLTATFSEVMDPLSINATTFTLRQGNTPILGTVTYTGVTAVFSPFAPMTSSAIYTATIRKEARDLAGNEMASDFVWTFTIGDAVDSLPPFVVFTDPDDEATGVGINKKIAATFSETMNPVTVNTATFTLQQGNTPILGTVVYSGVTAVFSPLVPLASNTTYTATVRMEATDLAGNQMASDQAWSFTTGSVADTVPPIVESSDPLDGAVGVPLNKAINATFSKGMDPLTITTSTFTVSQGGTPLAGTVTYTDNQATFQSSSNLTANTTYTAKIVKEVTDLAGNQMTNDVMWEFTTGVTTAQQTIELGSTSAFAVLAGSTVSSTGPSVLNGDLGVSPGTAVTGFPPGIVNGDTFTGAASAAGQAKADLTTAFNEAANRSTGSVSLPGDLSGLTLYPGLYTNSTSVMVSAGAVTLDAQGDSNAVFLFKMGSTLTTGPGTQVILSGGANAANIYWQVGSSATLGTTSTFQGNILAQESITMATGSTLVGRALTQTAAVSLDSATITTPAP